MSTERKKAPTWAVSTRKPNLRSEQDAPQPPKKWDLIKASDIAPEEVHWLWYPYIPAGNITSIEGDPGVGKSWLTAALAAHISSGRPLPGQTEAPKPSRVLMLSGEDSLAQSIVPRLTAMEANLDLIFFPNNQFTLDPEGIKGMEDAMRAAAATIVFIDPVQLFMGGKVDMNRANEVRVFMNGLHVAADRTKSAIIIVRHMRKAGAGTAIYRGLGSIDFTAAVRSVLQVSKDDAGVRHMRHEKSNYAPEGYDLSYTIEDQKFVWGNQSPRAGVSTTSNRKSGAAKAFLETILRNGPVEAMEVAKLAADEGIAAATLKRAKQNLVYSDKRGDTWYWSLIADPETGEIRG